MNFSDAVILGLGGPDLDCLQACGSQAALKTDSECGEAFRGCSG